LDERPIHPFTTLLDETVAGIRTRWSGQSADGQTEALKSICLTVAVIVHAPIESPRGFAVPLGFVSFDAAVLRRAEQCVLDNLSAYVVDNSLYREVAAALSGQKP
jgi:hypothetical protein